MKKENINRAQRVQRLSRDYDPLDPRSSVIDMLTDLRHLCDKEALDYADLDRIAYGHYIEELA